MKAMVVKAAQAPITLEERPKPKAGPGQVVIKVKACGVCHSDMAMQQGVFPFGKFPIVLGHEVAGVVDEVGPGVTWPKVGGSVGMPWLYDSCGHCDLCVRGDEIMCPEMTITGVNRDGGYQEYMLAPAAYVAPIPEGLDFAEAAPLMCAGLTVFNGIRVAGYKPGAKVAVMGLGGLGSLAVQYAKSLGARVAVLSTSPEKVKEAEKLGAEKFINTKKEDVVQALRAWDGGADIIVATAPNPEPMTQAFPGLAADGTLVVLGVGPGMITTSPMDLVGQRRKLMGSPSGSRHDLRDTLKFSLHNDVKPQIVKMKLEDAPKAHELMHGGKLVGRAVLIME